MRKYQVIRLPSGFWAVFFEGSWLTASLRSSDECIQFIKDHKTTYNTK